MPKNDKNVKKTYPKRKFKRRGPPVEVIEIYNKIILDTDGTYKFSDNITSFDIKSAVINSDEYLSMIKLWTRFKPKSVEAVFKKQINLVDVMLPELLMRFSLFVTNNNPDLSINPKACTHWSMLDNQVKRCYAPINPKFTDRDNCDWQQTNSSLACPIFCKISQALPGDIPTRPISLGVVKFKISFIVEKKDVKNLVSNQKEMEQELAKKDKEIQQLKEILRLEEDTKKKDKLKEKEIKVEDVGVQCDLDKELKEKKMKIQDKKDKAAIDYRNELDKLEKKMQEIEDRNWKYLEKYLLDLKLKKMKTPEAKQPNFNMDLAVNEDYVKEYNKIMQEQQRQFEPYQKKREKLMEAFDKELEKCEQEEEEFKQQQSKKSLTQLKGKKKKKKVRNQNEDEVSNSSINF